VILFVAAATSTVIVVIGGWIWLRLAEWPTWFLAMWLPEPTSPQFAGVQQILDWIWLQPILQVDVSLGVLVPMALLFIALGVIKLGEAN
jgi:hypothetical protein